MRRVAWITFGSLLLHAVALWMLPGHSPRPFAESPQPSLVMFESAEPASSISPAHPIPSETPPLPQLARRVVAEPHVLEEPQASQPHAIAPETAAVPAPMLVPAPPSAPARLDLSPRAAALSTVPLASTAPSRPAVSTHDLSSERAEELSGYLRSAARAEVDRLRASRPLELRREADGTCHYAGSAIDATILPDGGVVFSEKSAERDTRWGVDEPPERAYTADDTVAPQRLELGVRVVPRAWHAERTWFLRETEGIRRELADAAHERELRESEHQLRAQLDRIWCDDSRSKSERRRAIYRLWADISSDEVGQRGRAVIVAYVRRNLPAGSPDAYSLGELTALAALSEPAQRFDPYAGSEPLDAGLPSR